MAEVGSWLSTPVLSGKGQVWIRECYRDLYTDMRELASLGMRFIHVSGNSGIGKSSFLWYVLTKLLSEGVPEVIVQLVQGDPPKLMDTLVFKPDGSCSEEASPNFRAPGAWLLTDQAFVGKRAWNGTTVLFASPKESNWIHAEKTMEESKFRTLFMPPWSVEELQIVFFSKPENTGQYTKFWVMYYVAGPIVRYYSMTFKKAYDTIKMALNKVLELGVVNSTLLNGGWDNGSFSHKIFVSWPTLDFTGVHHISFISEWVVDSFAIACYNGKIRDWMVSTQSLASDSLLRTAAGVLFERYAHFRLSRGGDFCSIDDPEVKLRLEKREVKYFSGNSLDLKIPGICYFQQSSTSFPVIDSVYPPLVLFQISLAVKRKAIKKSDYEALCSSLMAFRAQHPTVSSGLEGVAEPDRVHAVLVKMEGDRTKHSERLCMVEDVPVDQTESRPSKATPRRSERLKTVQRRIFKVKREETGGFVKRRTYLPFQMTITLRMEDPVTEQLGYSSIQEIYSTVGSRMDDTVDTGARKFGDTNTQVVEDCATLLMRRGRGSIQYEEGKDGIPVFGAWIEAVRTEAKDSQLAEKTVVRIQCTAGELAARKLTIFVNERLSPDNEFAPPLVLDMLQESSQKFDTPALAAAWDRFKSEETALKILCSKEQAGVEIDAGVQRVRDADAAFRSAYGAVYEFSYSGGATATVVIRSNQRASKKFKLVFPSEGDDAEVEYDVEDMEYSEDSRT